MHRIIHFFISYFFKNLYCLILSPIRVLCFLFISTRNDVGYVSCSVIFFTKRKGRVSFFKATNTVWMCREWTQQSFFSLLFPFRLCCCWWPLNLVLISFLSRGIFFFTVNTGDFCLLSMLWPDQVILLRVLNIESPHLSLRSEEDSIVIDTIWNNFFWDAYVGWIDKLLFLILSHIEMLL